MSKTTGKRGWPPAGMHGARVRGVSGVETVYFATAGAARRVRRAVRYWADRGGWTGCATLGALATYAGSAAARGKRTRRIVADFRAARAEAATRAGGAQ